jgi:hypothetical protein
MAYKPYLYENSLEDLGFTQRLPITGEPTGIQLEQSLQSLVAAIKITFEEMGPKVKSHLINCTLIHLRGKGHDISFWETKLTDYYFEQSRLKQCGISEISIRDALFKYCDVAFDSISVSKADLTDFMGGQLLYNTEESLRQSITHATRNIEHKDDKTILHFSLGTFYT